MGLRTFQQLTFEVGREVGDPVGRATTFEVQQAINDSYREIVQYANWTFLVDRIDIRMEPAYETGTVTVVDGSTTVTGSGTVWNTAWWNRKILIQGDNCEKEVASVTDPTHLELRYPYTATGTTLTGLSYQLYQDTYPVNISPGSDLVMRNPMFDWSRLVKWDRYTFDDRLSFNRFSQALRPEVYTDAGADPFPLSPTYNQPRFQFWPRPTAPQDLVLSYYRLPPALSAATSTTVLPPEFEEILILLAKYRVKRRYGIMGWMEHKQEAMRLLVQFREKLRTSSAYDFSPNAVGFTDPYAIDQSLGSWPANVRP